MRTATRGLRAAFVFLTRLPVGGFPYTEAEWRWSAGWFPLVGAAVGALSAGAWMLAAPLGPWVAALAAIATSVLVTGAFHEDGLADTADALGGGYGREAVLRILKDPRVGTFGALALIGSVAFRLVLLVRLGDHTPVALVLAHTLARIGPIWLLVTLPYVTDRDARSRQVARASSRQGWLAAGIGAVAVLAVLVARTWSAGPLLSAVVAIAAVNLLCGWRFRARTGGVTGDFLGAAEQAGEVAVLFVLAGST